VIDVAYDAEGVRMALEALFEEDFVRARIERVAGSATAESRQRMEWQIPKRVLSPGYYRWAEHIFRLDAERRAGVGFTAGELAGVEVAGLVALDRARGAFENAHPACSACGLRQENRFGRECPSCGAKFRRKK
jgi:hypothetical protein